MNREDTLNQVKKSLKIAGLDLAQRRAKPKKQFNEAARRLSALAAPAQAPPQESSDHRRKAACLNLLRSR